MYMVSVPPRTWEHVQHGRLLCCGGQATLHPLQPTGKA